MYDAMYAAAARQLAETLAGRARGADPRETLRGLMRLFTGFCVADPVRYQMLFERPVPGFAPAPESFQVAARRPAHTPG